ncbi:MAG: MFS transporter [Thermoanaerobaculia bacterium]
MPPLKTASPPPRFDPRRRRAVTAALVLVTALASFESTVVSTAMPTIIGDLGGLPLYSWVFAIYLLTSTVMMPIYGRLADIYGRRRILLTGIGVFLSGAVACAFARSMPQLIGARALQGLGAAGLVPVSLTVAADLYSLQERARVQGIFSGVWGLAALVGPLMGAWMTVSFGWRSIFSINVPLGIVAIALVATQMIESRAARPGELDLAGSATLGLGVTALLFGVLHVPSAKAPGAAVRFALFAVGAACLWAFARIQRRRKDPLVPPDLFKTWKTVAPYLSGVLLGTTIFGVDTFVPLFVQGARGGTPGAAGAVITPLIFFWALSAAIGARLIVRFGFRASTRAGAITILVGLTGLFAGALADASVPWISAACGLVGLGLGPCSIAQILAIQHVVPEERRGVATSLAPFFRTIGGSIGVGALGGILSAGLSNRLGPLAESAGRLLSAQAALSGPPPPIPLSVLGSAIERSLLPVFAILAALSVLNVLLASRFPEKEDGHPVAGSEEVLAV